MPYSKQAMKPSLQLKLSTHLTLTPQLQQSIRLLQLSTLELSQELDQMVMDNPLLERLDDPLDLANRIAPDGVLQSGTVGPAPDPMAIHEAGERAPREAARDSITSAESPDASMPEGSAEDAEFGGDNLDWGGSSGSGVDRDGDDDLGSQQVGNVTVQLRDHLLQQLHATRCSTIDRGLVEFLIDNLDGAGYLDGDLEELMQLLPPELELDLEQLQLALRLLQSFDPVGVGARNLTECLLLQLDQVDHQQWPEEIRRLARTTIKHHLALLGARDYNRLRATLGCDDETLRQMHELIRSLNPRPGNAFGEPENHYVIPDVVVRKVKNDWRVFLNSDAVPRLRVNEHYARLLSSSRQGGKALSAQLQEARWLVKNVEQRFDTILRVSQAIVDRQKAFFNHGELAMRPLVLREIADQLDLHESTISRVTSQKYMLTPFGILELKYFFGSHVQTEAGGAASSTAIRALIKQIINAEKPTKPLSDSRIAELLGEQGFVVARRTVAKYRESLEIPAVSQRKAI